MSTQTIDQRIREKAAKDWAARVAAAFERLRKELDLSNNVAPVKRPTSNTPGITVQLADGIRVGYDHNTKGTLEIKPWPALRAVESAVAEAYSQREEEAAVAAFLTRVDSLASEVEEIRHLAGV